MKVFQLEFFKNGKLKECHKLAVVFLGQFGELSKEILNMRLILTVGKIPRRENGHFSLFEWFVYFWRQRNSCVGHLGAGVINSFLTA